MITKVVKTFLDKGYALTDPDKITGAVKSALLRLHNHEDKECIMALYEVYRKFYGVHGYEMLEDAIKRYYQNENKVRKL